MHEIKEQREFATSKINSLKEDFKKAVDAKLAEISQLWVYLLNAIENLQEIDEKLDKFSKTFTSTVETAKEELTEWIRQILFQSTLIDLTTLGLPSECYREPVGNR